MNGDMDLASERRTRSLVQDSHYQYDEKQKIKCPMKGERKRAVGVKRKETIFSIYSNEVEV